MQPQDKKQQSQIGVLIVQPLTREISIPVGTRGSILKKGAMRGLEDAKHIGIAKQNVSSRLCCEWKSGMVSPGKL